jgi:hypothetical protein
MRSAPVRPLLLATLAVAALGSCADLSAQHESRRVYVNHEFGFSAELPFYAPTCDPSQENQETGFVFFLDAGGSDCAMGMPDRRWVSYHEVYNAMDFESTRAAAEKECANGTLTATDPQLFGDLAQSFPFTCLEHPQVGIDLYSFEKLSANGAIKCGAYLQTAPDDFEKDRATFLATLQTLKHFTADPTDVRGTGYAAILSRQSKEAVSAKAGGKGATPRK